MSRRASKIRPLSVDHLNEIFDQDLTWQEKLSDKITQFLGTWKFICIYLCILLIWVFINLQSGFAFDPYPFILLNLFLSFLAGFQAPIILMSQNRSSVKDRSRDEIQYDVTQEIRLGLAELQDKAKEAERDNETLRRELIDLKQELSNLNKTLKIKYKTKNNWKKNPSSNKKDCRND